MASKFGGIVAQLSAPPAPAKAPATVEPVASPPPEAVASSSGDSPEPEAPAKRGRGRPRGKSSNPEYRATTVYLKRSTLSRAMREINIMREQGAFKPDLSSVLEESLNEWATYHREMRLNIAKVNKDFSDV